MHRALIFTFGMLVWGHKFSTVLFVVVRRCFPKWFCSASCVKFHILLVLVLGLFCFVLVVLVAVQTFYVNLLTIFFLFVVVVVAVVR